MAVTDPILPIRRRPGAALSRTDVRKVQCPACRAWPGYACWTWKDGKSIRRKSNHRERIHLAYELAEPRAPLGT